MNAALSLLTGALLILVFPRFSLTMLAPLALAPLLYASAREPSSIRRFFAGWAAGFAEWFCVCYWIQFVLENHGGLGRELSWVAMALFAVMKGLNIAIFSWMAGPLMRRAWAIPATAALWTGLERAYWPFGFTWLNLGNAGIDMPVLLRLAPLTGVYGLSFVFAMTSCAVALIVLRRPRRQLAWLLALPLLYLLPALPPGEPGTELVQVVQPNIDTELRWTEESLTTLEQHMAALSRANVPLIVWPEAPAPFYPASPSFREFLAQVTTRSNAHLFFTGVARNEKGAPLNSAFLVNPAGQIVDRYDKINLVPFGEYVPRAFSWVNRITQETSDFEPGTRVVTFDVGGHRMGAFICYESAFPSLVRQFTVNGAEVLLNLSNDGYFGDTAAREQHLALARMRAAENRRWMLRATNDGITAMIDPAGRITDQMSSFAEAAATMRYKYVSHLSLYTRLGDWFAWLCCGAGLLAWLFRPRDSRNYSRSS